MCNAYLPQADIRYCIRGLAEYNHTYTMQEMVDWVADIFGVPQSERGHCQDSGNNTIYQRVSAALEVARRKGEIPRTGPNTSIPYGVIRGF